MPTKVANTFMVGNPSGQSGHGPGLTALLMFCESQLCQSTNLGTAAAENGNANLQKNLSAQNGLNAMVNGMDLNSLPQEPAQMNQQQRDALTNAQQANQTIEEARNGQISLLLVVRQQANTDATGLNTLAQETQGSLSIASAVLTLLLQASKDVTQRN